MHFYPQSELRVRIMLLFLLKSLTDSRAFYVFTDFCTPIQVLAGLDVLARNDRGATRFPHCTVWCSAIVVIRQILCLYCEENNLKFQKHDPLIIFLA